MRAPRQLPILAILEKVTKNAAEKIRRYAARSIKRRRMPAPVARSMAVHAMATAPSNSAWSADAVMQCAVNAG
jgi:hypothetical protein